MLDKKIIDKTIGDINYIGIQRCVGTWDMLKGTEMMEVIDELILAAKERDELKKELERVKQDREDFRQDACSFSEELEEKFKECNDLKKRVRELEKQNKQFEIELLSSQDMYANYIQENHKYIELGKALEWYHNVSPYSILVTGGRTKKARWDLFVEEVLKLYRKEVSNE